MAIVNGTNNSETLNAADGVTNDSDAIYGFGGADSIFGLGGADLLVGGLDDDTLDGGAGDDTMRGGLGNDTFFVDSAGDVVIEAANEGTDTVKASVSYELSGMPTCRPCGRPTMPGRQPSISPAIS